MIRQGRHHSRHFDLFSYAVMAAPTTGVCIIIGTPLLASECENGFGLGQTGTDLAASLKELTEKALGLTEESDKSAGELYAKYAQKSIDQVTLSTERW